MYILFSNYLYCRIILQWHSKGGINKQFCQGVKNDERGVGFQQESSPSTCLQVLLYEKVGHFKAHRDTDKEKG